MYVRTAPLGAFGDIDWTSVINNAVTTAGQIARPGSPSPVPTYSATPYRSTSSDLLKLGLIGAALVLVPKLLPARRR